MPDEKADLLKALAKARAEIEELKLRLSNASLFSVQDAFAKYCVPSSCLRCRLESEKATADSAGRKSRI